MLKAFRYRIYPTPSQAEFLNRSIDSCRFIYNWGLAKKIELYQKEGTGISCFSLMKLLPQLKEEHEWLREINSQALQVEFVNLDKAYQSFFKKNGGFPKFKSKHRSRKSFSCPQSCKVDFEKGTLSIPKCKGIKAVLHRRFEGTIKTVTISQSSSGKYFASVLVEDGKELPDKAPINSETSVGLDVGIKHFVTFSTGEKIDNPKHLKQSEARLKVLQRRLSRKEKGSNNRNKARLRMAKLHEKIANQRGDFHHQLSARLARENQTVIVEDLNVKGMVKNHCLAKAISDCGWSQFKEYLRYKCEWHGRNFVEIGRFEPSSKMCSCGVVNQELKLSDRDWVCHSCGTIYDRDVLASQNIKRFGLIQNQGRNDPLSLWSSPAVTGCVETGSPAPCGHG
jgi:putative transposase